MTRQRGSILIVSLGLLAILTLIGLSGANTTTLEERMSGNFRDQQVAFQSAEAVLADAESWIEANDLATITGPDTACIAGQCFDSSCSNGLCFNGTQASTYGQCQHVEPQSPVWARDNTLDVFNTPSRYRTASQDSELDGSQGGGRYIVEFLCFMRLDPDQPDSAELHGSSAFFRDYAEVYRITAMGFGATPNARSVVQSTYRKVR